MEEKKGTSPWVFIGVGCLLLVFLIVAVIVATGAWGFSQVRELQRSLEDPEARADAGAETHLSVRRAPEASAT